MPNGDNRRRSYGYERSDTQRATREQETPSPRPRTKKPESRITEQRPVNWPALVLFPFRLLGMLLVRIFQAVGWIVKKIPWGAPFQKGRRKTTVKVLAWLFVIGCVGLVGLFVWASKDLPDPDKLTDRQVAQSTKIYDRTGTHILYEVFADKKRTLVTLEELPEDLVHGVIATEDTKFYEHHGIRPLSLIRSVLYGVVGKGRIGGGASTLTQQLVKNAILTSERTLTRKLKEFILAVRLEQKYSKDQILQIYFNEIPYGSTNYGVESAAQSYFGKHASELNLQESATLAGLPQAPSYYLSDKEALKGRRNFVLSRMFAEGFISEQEMKTAQASALTLDRSISDIDAPHFVLYVKQKLVEQYGEKTVDSGGLKVITSLDWEKQQIAEDVVDTIGTPALAEAEANNTALISLDPHTGQILAMVGSKDFYDDSIDGQFNVATLAKRQPGSSFKPIIYAAAFEKGYTPETVLFDVVTDFGKGSGQSYKPLNYDLSEHGPVTIRQALQGSLNIPAVKALYLVGEKEGVDFAERLGYSTLGADNFGLSLVLGGGEVTPLDHASAYATFANGGIRHAPVSILKVEDNTGEVLYEWKQDRGDTVLNKNITDTLSNVLSDDAARAYAFGEGSLLTLKDRPVAAKTGTTNNYVDAWTVGYTPSLVTAVWAGNTDNTPMKRGNGGSKVATPIWNAYMTRALEGTTVETFDTPTKADTDKAVLNGSTGGGITLSVDKITGKIATSSTPPEYIEERTYIQAHSILHYVDKDNPQGDIPAHPELDPQYVIWEEAIQDWITRKKEKDPEWNVTFEDPPSEYDDAHALELIPSLVVVYPEAHSTLTSRQIDTDIRASAPRGVNRVVYQLDGAYIGVVDTHPFNLSYYAQGLAPGAHTLMVTVEDDVGNRVVQEVPFTLAEIAEESPSVSWPQATLSTRSSEFPKTFLLKTFRPEDVARLDVTAEKAGTTVPVATITDFTNLFIGQVTVVWSNAPTPGTWTLTAKTTAKSGALSTATMSVEVN